MNLNIRCGSMQASHSASFTDSPLSKKGVDHPAATYMLPRLSAVVQNVGLVATSLFQRVGQDGKAVEGPVIVDGLSHLRNPAVVPTTPCGVNGRLAVWIAEDVPKKAALDHSFILLNGLPITS